MPLPAPYAPPWKRLGEDGVALLAWLGLKARELWRRNREGSLPVPPFWPRRRPQLFWPLVLTVLLAGVGLLARAWLGLSADRPAGPTPENVTAADPRGLDGDPAAPFVGSRRPPAEGGRAGPTAEGRAAERVERRETALEDRPAAESAERSEAESPDRPAIGLADRFAEQPADRSPAGEPRSPRGSEEAPPSPLPSPADREALRVRAAWSDAAAESLIVAFRPEPATLTLTLSLDDAFLTLPAGERERLAERWRQRALEAGYSHLRLREGRGRLVGRDAVVGGGMVVLDPPGEGGEEP